MNKETIYRVQDKDGRGPWKPGFSHKWVIARPDHDNLMPWFMEMGPIHLEITKGLHWGTGCTSIDQLKRWFTEKEYKTLLKLGYKSVLFKADRILGKSMTQCLFERNKPLKDDIAVFELY